jgi:hypothetical protein
VKVCPHCAEELRPEATVCSNCHKDPAQLPAWATSRRADAPAPWWSADQPPRDDDPDIPRTVPTGYSRLEPAAARQPWLGIPAKIRASLFIAIGWGFAVSVVAQLLLRGGVPPTTRSLLLPLWLGGYVVGLILGIRGRAEVEESDRVGQILAWGGIGLNGLRLLFFVVSAAIMRALL